MKRPDTDVIEPGEPRPPKERTPGVASQVPPGAMRPGATAQAPGEPRPPPKVLSPGEVLPPRPAPGMPATGAARGPHPPRPDGGAERRVAQEDWERWRGEDRRRVPYAYPDWRT
jgi:hypothetical protein